MSKIKLIEYKDENGQKFHGDQYMYWCDGCGFEHVFALQAEGGHHQFNGDLDNPTVVPSLVEDFTPGRMCHSFIRNGNIQYLTDCSHHLAGKTIELPDIDTRIEEKHQKATNT